MTDLTSHPRRSRARRPGRQRLSLRWAHRLGQLALILLAIASWAGESHAQASSWFYSGGGAGIIEQSGSKTRPLLQIDAGLGTSANLPLVVGGVFRLHGHFGGGLDLGLASRVVSRGFARGGFGMGIDLGAYQRWWGQHSTGAMGNLVLGGPWGVTLIAGASAGTNDQRAVFVSLGIDLARLTVHRHTGLNWMSNPMRSPAEE